LIDARLPSRSARTSRLDPGIGCGPPAGRYTMAIQEITNTMRLSPGFVPLSIGRE
jgi:hypothetical protein